MAKQEEGDYKISKGPVTSSPLRNGVIESDDLQTHHGQPLLLAIARNPRTLFVCWSVDWPAVFTEGLPTDRSAHVKLTSGSEEKTIPVEPMIGNCAIDDLEPGETYSVQIGYYAPAEVWNVVATANEAMMPFESDATDETVDVATVPFHLTFQRMLDAFRASNGDNLVRTLAQLQERSRQPDLLTRSDEEVLRALDLSAADLERTAAYRQEMNAVETLRRRGETLLGFGGSSWSGS